MFTNLKILGHLFDLRKTVNKLRDELQQKEIRQDRETDESFKLILKLRKKLDKDEYKDLLEKFSNLVLENTSLKKQLTDYESD